MWRDPIVEEIHAIREQIARECDYDLRRIMDRLRENEARHTGVIVSKEDLAKRRAANPFPTISRKESD